MRNLAAFFTVLFLTASLYGQKDIQSDVFKMEGAELELFFVGHGTLMFKYNSLIIHIDPVSREYGTYKVPEGDLILITHQHGDHLDASLLEKIVKEKTVTIMTQTCADNLEHSYGAIIMENGDTYETMDIGIEAVPAYNIQHKRNNGSPYHAKGEGNAYVLGIGGKRILIGGDTENVPEIKALENIDIAFLPMNLPYTMTPEMVADIATVMKPKVLYPYHFGSTNPQELVKLLKDYPDIDVRIRELD